MNRRTCARHPRVQRVATHPEMESNRRYERRRRGNSRFLVIFLLLALLTAGIGWGATTLMRRTKFFDITYIKIVGARSVPVETYQKALTGLRGRNLLTVFAPDVRRSLRPIVRVDKVKVGWILPDGLKVTVAERVAVFQIKTVDGDVFPVDSTGVVLNNVISGPVEDAPLVDLNVTTRSLTPGKQLESNTFKSAMKLQKAIYHVDRKFAERISEYYEKNGDLYFVEGESGARVIMGDDNVPEKLSRLVFFAENVGFAPGQVVDLRFKDQIVTRTGE